MQESRDQQDRQETAFTKMVRAASCIDPGHRLPAWRALKSGTTTVRPVTRDSSAARAMAWLSTFLAIEAFHNRILAGFLLTTLLLPGIVQPYPSGNMEESVTRALPEGRGR